MEHLLGARILRTTPSTSARGEPKRPSRSEPISPVLLLVHVVGVAALVAASVVAIADQSTRFVSGQEIVGVHEIPSFIADRVELPPGIAARDSALELAPGPDARAMGPDLAARDRVTDRL